MQQHINLLTVKTRHRGVVWWMVCVLVVFFIAYTTWLWVEHLRWVGLSQAHARTVQATADIKAQVIKQKKALGIYEAQDLGVKSAQLRQQLDKQRIWTDLLGKGELGRLEGPADLLTSLAQTHESGLWLEQIELTSGGERLRVRGTAMTLDAVLRYADHLSHRLGDRPLLSVKTSEGLSAAGLGGQPPVPLIHFELY